MRSHPRPCHRPNGGFSSTKPVFFSSPPKRSPPAEPGRHAPPGQRLPIRLDGAAEGLGRGAQATTGDSGSPAPSNGSTRRPDAPGEGDSPAPHRNTRRERTLAGSLRPERRGRSPDRGKAAPSTIIHRFVSLGGVAAGDRTCREGHLRSERAAYSTPHSRPSRQTTRHIASMPSSEH